MTRKSILIPRILRTELSGSYGYIYVTTNLVNHKKYLGQHFTNSVNANYLGSGKLLLKAIKKYGKANFVSEPIDYALNKEELDQKEMWWIDFLGCTDSKDWYNVTVGGEGVGGGKNHPLYGKCGESHPNFGRHWTDEVKQKISHTLISSGKMSGENNPNFGVQMSEEQKEKIRNTARLNPNFGMKGKKHTEASKKKMSINNNMKWNTKARQAARERLLRNNPAKHGRYCSNARKVYQYEINTGNYVGMFEAISEVKTKGYNVMCVRNCLAGNQKQHQGFIWSYLSPDKYVHHYPYSKPRK